MSFPSVLFYAQSGAGKSSLINAGLIPRLEVQNLKVFSPIRVGVQAPKPSNVEIRNAYIYNLLRQWDSNTDATSLADMTLDEFLAQRPHRIDEFGVQRPRVLIFDQFEELFRSRPVRWEQRKPFFEQVREALEADSLLRVVFAMRKEYVAEVDPYTPLLPDKLRVRLQLELLRRDAALRAITGPLEVLNIPFDMDAATSLVDKLLTIDDQETGERGIGEYVDPVYLQVVCANVWDSAERTGKNAIDEDIVALYGDPAQALGQFYNNCLKNVIESYGLEEKSLREWSERNLIGEDQAYKLRIVVDAKTGATNGIANEVIERFEDLHLLGDIVDGVRWTELAHDRLVESIKQS